MRDNPLCQRENTKYLRSIPNLSDYLPISRSCLPTPSFPTVLSPHTPPTASLPPMLAPPFPHTHPHPRAHGSPLQSRPASPPTALLPQDPPATTALYLDRNPDTPRQGNHTLLRRRGPSGRNLACGIHGRQVWRAGRLLVGFRAFVLSLKPEWGWWCSCQ